MNDKYQRLKHNLTEMREMCNLIIQHLDEEEKIIEANNNGLIQFDNPKHDLKKEYEKCDNRLSFVFNSYVFAVWNKFKYCPRITVIERTSEEQNLIYASNLDYQKNPWMSTHQTKPCRAIDFAVLDMSPEIIEFTLGYFKQVVYTGEKNTLLKHNVGWGAHFHLQVDKDNYTSIQKV